MFIDVHAHAYRHPWPGVNGKPVFSNPDQLLARHDELGIEKACLLPIVSPEVYLPQSNDEILDIVRQYPDRFVAFCNIDPRAVENSEVAPLGHLLRYYRDLGCKGVGEVMPCLPFLHPQVQNLFRHVQDAGLPLTIDMTAYEGVRYGLYDDPGLPQLERTLRLFPKLNIIGHGPPFWAEISRLETPGDRAGYPSYPVAEEGVVPKLMRRYPNLWADLSAGSGYNALARDPDYAVGFLAEFQDRLFFGTDICAPDQKAPLAGFLQQLRTNSRVDEAVFQKIAKGNAQRLLGV